jgi:hypothetical protein
MQFSWRDARHLLDQGLLRPPWGTLLPQIAHIYKTEISTTEYLENGLRSMSCDAFLKYLKVRKIHVIPGI